VVQTKVLEPRVEVAGMIVEAVRAGAVLARLPHADEIGR
jgi:hypothetical protein